MDNKQAKLGRLVVATLAGVVLAGCGAGEPANVEVLLRMNLCVDDGARCFALRIPEAEGSLVHLDGEVLATGTSDDAGKVRLPRSDAAGEVRVVAISPLIEGGRKESPLELPDEGSRSWPTVFTRHRATEDACGKPQPPSGRMIAWMLAPKLR